MSNEIQCDLRSVAPGDDVSGGDRVPIQQRNQIFNVVINIAACTIKLGCKVRDPARFPGEDPEIRFELLWEIHPENSRHPQRVYQYNWLAPGVVAFESGKGHAVIWDNSFPLEDLIRGLIPQLTRAFRNIAIEFLLRNAVFAWQASLKLLLL